MNPPGPNRTTNLFGALALVAADGIRQATEQAAKHGAAAPAALVALYESLGGGSVDDVCRAVGLTPSGAVRLIDRLVDEGYVERRAGSDRRSVSVVLTSRGRRAARTVLTARAEVLDRMLRTLTAAERAAFTAIIEKLLRASTEDRMDDRQGGHLPTGGWMCRLCDFAACGRDRGLCPAASTAASLLGNDSDRPHRPPAS